MSYVAYLGKRIAIMSAKAKRYFSRAMDACARLDGKTS